MVKDVFGGAWGKGTSKDFFKSDHKFEVTPVYSTDPKLMALLTDIWHNQATIIKWLSKIAENTKPPKGKWDNIK